MNANNKESTQPANWHTPLSQNQPSAHPTRSLRQWGLTIIALALVTAAGVEAGPALEDSKVEEMVVRTTAMPSQVVEGQRTTITVRVLSKKTGIGITGASVRVWAGGGRFLAKADEKIPRTGRLHEPYQASGLTDRDGVFTTWWVVRRGAPAYVMNVEVQKDGFKSARAELRVSLGSGAPSSSAPSSLPRLVVRSQATPATVTEGTKSKIQVQVVNEGTSASITGAAVRVLAGGGRFLAKADEEIPSTGRLHEPYEVSGLTDRDGVFTTWWVVRPGTSVYVMQVEAQKDGFAPASTNLQIRVAH